jgi:hypothetical protein
MIIQYHSENKYFKEFEYTIELIKDNKLKNTNVYFQIIPDINNLFNSFLYNTEQLTRMYWLEKITHYSKLLPICDYSADNIKLIKIFIVIIPSAVYQHLNLRLLI